MMIAEICFVVVLVIWLFAVIKWAIAYNHNNIKKMNKWLTIVLVGVLIINICNLFIQCLK